MQRPSDESVVGSPYLEWYVNKIIAWKMYNEPQGIFIFSQSQESTERGNPVFVLKFQNEKY